MTEAHQMKGNTPPWIDRAILLATSDGSAGVALEPIIEERVALVREVKQVVIDDLGLNLIPDEIDCDCSLFAFGLGMDSIDALTLVSALEDNFHVTVADDRLDTLHSVNTIADFIVESRGAP